LKKFFKLTAWLLAVVLLFAALAAAGAVMIGQWIPDGATIHLGDEMITLGEGATLGIGTGLFIWMVVTFALFVSFFAVVFAFAVAGLALFSVGVLLISPVLSVILVVWLIARAMSKRKPAPISTAPTAAA
jgi:hypothetical protein